MTPQFDDCIDEIVEYENDRSGGRYDISSLVRLSKPGFKNQVKDSAEVFHVKRLSDGNRFIITLSNPGFPDSVNHAVDRANAVRALLDPGLAGHILSPTITGECNGRSYAFWPLRVPISDNRFLRKAQFISINSKVIQWITDVGKLTQVRNHASEELKSRYATPLAFVLNDNDMPSAVKQAAENTLISLDSFDFRPVCVVQHGDFWHGNILLERVWPFSLRFPLSFYVIDWGGSSIRGYPFIDSLRYLMSVTRQETAILRYLVSYHRQTGLPFNDIVHYACTYVGYLGMNRGEFPLDRYYASSSALIQKASDLLSDFKNS